MNGAISPDMLSGGTFTVSNLGALGVELYTPVINPPQTGIIGVCSMIDRPRRMGSGIELYPAMGLSLTYDHRAVDGAPASRFLQEVCKTFPNFETFLADEPGGVTDGIFRSGDHGRRPGRVTEARRWPRAAA